MLFNTLAHLRVLIKLRPDDQAMLDELIAYLRATLQSSRSTSHSLAEEFARLRDYLGLMKRRMGERLRVELDLPEDLAALPVPPLLLQPLVENAIKHGLEPHVEGGLLRVQCHPREGSFWCCVFRTAASAWPPLPAPMQTHLRPPPWALALACSRCESACSTAIAPRPSSSLLRCLQAAPWPPLFAP